MYVFIFGIYFHTVNFLYSYSCAILKSIYRLLCQEINQDDSFHLEYRGPVVMKGKPTPMDCWFLTRNTTSSGIVTVNSEPTPPTPSALNPPQAIPSVGQQPATSAAASAQSTQLSNSASVRAATSSSSSSVCHNTTAPIPAVRTNIPLSRTSSNTSSTSESSQSQAHKNFSHGMAVEQQENAEHQETSAET